MKIFLSQNFNSAIFIGELIASLLIIFLSSLTSFYFKNRKYARINLIGVSLIGSIFIGQGIANTINGAPIFGLLPIAIIASFFFEAYSLLPIIILAQILGSFIGFLTFRLHKILFKNFELKETSKNHIILSNGQITFKEITAQLILIIALTFVTFATFNNGLSSIDVSSLIRNLICLSLIMGLLFIFDSIKGFMVSPIITLFMKLSLTNRFREIFKISKKIDSSFLMTFTLQTTINISLTIIICLITNAIKWWT